MLKTEKVFPVPSEKMQMLVALEKRLKDHQLSELLDAFIANHPHLAEFIYSDQSIQLMNTDGRIAAHIIGTLTAKKIPVLAIHDSFIVERYHFAELRLAMSDASMKYCRRNLIAEQEGLVVDFSDGLSMRWRTINEHAVNKLPKYEPCDQYLHRLNRFCEADDLVQERSIAGRGLGARKVNVLKNKDVSTSKALELPPNEANDNHMAI